MAQEEMTVREVCEALGVSRAMVQKLEASGELTRIRGVDRVLFRRGQVTALAEAREVNRAERRQEAEDREARGEDAEMRRRNVEFTVWTKSTFEMRRLHELEDDLATVRFETEALKNTQRWQELTAEANARARRNERVKATQSEGQLSPEMAGLVMVGLLGYLAYKERAPVVVRNGPAAAGSSVALDDGKLVGAIGARPDLRTSDELQKERLLMEKVKAGTATSEDLDELGKVLWRMMHSENKG